MKRIAVIGCGLRSDCYLHELRDGLGTEWELAGLADPSPVALDCYRRNYDPHGRARTFADGPTLLAALAGRLDGVIIASPNALHMESALPAMAAGLTILLEKPVATTAADCATLWEAYERAGHPPLVVGFVLRYAPFYRQVKAILASGDLGRILSIEAGEWLGPPLTALYMRGWRRHQALSGPFILEKCSHDMDILNWLAEAPATGVASFASRSHFVPRPDAAARCADCGLAETCRYHVARVEPYIMNVARRASIAPLIDSRDDLCVYNADKDIADHQVVSIRYANGILASLTLCCDQPRTTRTIRVCGTRGQLVGDIGKDELRIVRHHGSDSRDGAVEHVPIERDASGHHGGDSILTNQFKAMLRGDATAPLAGLREGIAAARLALAAQHAADHTPRLPADPPGR